MWICMLMLSCLLTSQYASAQCTFAVDTICNNELDTVYINSNPAFTTINWFTSNGATLSVLPGDTSVVVDWSTSSIVDAVDSVCVAATSVCGIDTACIVTYLKDCVIPDSTCCIDPLTRTVAISCFAASDADVSFAMVDLNQTQCDLEAGSAGQNVFEDIHQWDTGVTATRGQVGNPQAITIDNTNRFAYVHSTRNSVYGPGGKAGIHRIDLRSGAVTTLTTTGTATAVGSSALADAFLGHASFCHTTETLIAANADDELFVIDADTTSATYGEVMCIYIHTSAIYSTGKNEATGEIYFIDQVHDHYTIATDAVGCMTGTATMIMDNSADGENIPNAKLTHFRSIRFNCDFTQYITSSNSTTQAHGFAAGIWQPDGTFVGGLDGGFLTDRTAQSGPGADFFPSGCIDRDGCIETGCPMEGHYITSSTKLNANIDPLAWGYTYGAIANHLTLDGNSMPSAPADSLMLLHVAGVSKGDLYDVETVHFLEHCCPKDGPDKDGDGIPDFVDIDDDNDGITDSLECELLAEERIRPSDFGWGMGIDDASLNATNVDLSAKWGLPAGSVLVSVTGGNSHPVTDAFVSINNFDTEFAISGTTPIFALISHGSVLTAGDTEGFEALDGASYTYVTSGLDPGINLVNAGNQYYVENTGANANNSFGPFDWESNSPIINFKLVTTADINSNVVRIYFTPQFCPDTDGDGITDNLDLDSDNDGIPDAIEACGDITLELEDCMLGSDTTSFYPDYNGDGCPDGLDTLACADAPVDTDGDGTPDYLDLDSDGDGCPDAIEAGSTGDINDGLDTMYNAPAAMVDTCGLVLDGGAPVCNTPADDSWTMPGDFDACCDLAETDPVAFCEIVTADSTSMLSTFDCDMGGIDNFTECSNSGDPGEPSDDCDIAIAIGMDICALLDTVPTSPLATLDCDGGGVDNQTECDNSTNPSVTSDDCDAAIASGMDICALLDTVPTSPMATLDCDGGGIDNQTECDNSTDPAVASDDCDAAIAAGEDICAILTADPTSPMATLDCDMGGVDNQTECDNSTDPGVASDDCDAIIAAGTDICAFLDANPGSPLATMDCDMGGIDNQTECDNSSDPRISSDDCDAAMNAGVDICMILDDGAGGYGPMTHPLATLDCDNGGVDNITECMDGTDPGITSDDAVVPIELISFTGKQLKDCSGLIQWSTGVETNFSHFELMLSRNNENFYSHSIIDGIGGNSTNYYEKQVNESYLPSYFQLKMVDLDGSYELSNTIFVQDNCALESGEITVFPIPTSDLLLVEFSSKLREEVTVRVVDDLGRILLEEQKEITSSLTKFEINVDHYASGHYFLEIIGKEKSFVKKFIKIDN